MFEGANWGAVLFFALLVFLPRLLRFLRLGRRLGRVLRRG